MRFILTLLIFGVSLFGDSYDIKYRGITLGEIQTLSTLENGYLKAKVTNPIVKMMLRKKNFVFYGRNKPNISDTKYKKDGKKILFALKTAIEQRPTNEKFIIDVKRYITLECKDNVCSFDYYTSGKHNAEGKIEFDKNGKFVKLTEKKSSVVIERR